MTSISPLPRENCMVLALRAAGGLCHHAIPEKAKLSATLISKGPLTLPNWKAGSCRRMRYHGSALNFDESKGRMPPQSLPNFADSWASYYEWRKLPISSPAAHLLHWPLTIYRMLRVLGIDAGSVQSRKSLTIFLVGVEVSHSVPN